MSYLCLVEGGRVLPTPHENEGSKVLLILQFFCDCDLVLCNRRAGVSQPSHATDLIFISMGAFTYL